MKSIVMTLIIAGTALILAPIAIAYHQSTKTAEVLPYVVTESDLDKATKLLETPTGWEWKWGYPLAGAVMVGFGIGLSVKHQWPAEKEGTLRIEGTVEVKK